MTNRLTEKDNQFPLQGPLKQSVEGEGAPLATGPAPRESSPNSVRIVIAGGGTGGHLFPGIAVAQEFQTALGATCTFLTTPKTVTAQILERYGITWEAMESRALKGQGLGQRALTWCGLPGSILKARGRLQALSPQLVLGMGGHTSGPVGVAAFSMGIPLALHEQNAIPGFTNRCLSRLARRIFVSFPASRDYFPAGRAVWTGNPIREEFFRPAPERPEAPFTVLITGGSQGAHHLNLETLKTLPRLAEVKERLWFLHLSGEADQEEVAAGYRQAGFAAEVAAFTPEVALWMAKAHLVVCRAGASTLAELTAMGRAAILVPYPFAANNHQEQNARFLAESGAAEMKLNKDFTGEFLADRILKFLSEPESRKEMEEKSRRLARPDAAKEIVAGCRELIKKKVRSAHPT